MAPRWRSKSPRVNFPSLYVHSIRFGGTHAATRMVRSRTRSIYWTKSSLMPSRSERLLQRPQLCGQCRHLFLQPRHANGERLAGRCGMSPVGRRLGLDDGPPEDMRPARLLLAGPARQLADECGLVRHPLQRLLHLAHGLESMQAVAASAQFARGLRAAKEEE